MFVWIHNLVCFIIGGFWFIYLIMIIIIIIFFIFFFFFFFLIFIITIISFPSCVLKEQQSLIADKTRVGIQMIS